WTMLAALASETVNKVAPLLTMHFAASRLGAAGFGVSQFALWLLEWGIILVAFGYPQAIPVALRRAENLQEKKELAGALVLNRLVLAACAGVALLVVVRSNPDYGIYWPAVASSLFILLLSAFDMSGVLIAVQRVSTYSMMMIGAKLASLGAVWMLIQSTRDINLYVLITNAANGLICVGSFLLAWNFLGLSRPSISQMRKMFRLSLPFAISAFALVLVERFDLYLIERSVGPLGAGWYSGPTKLMQSFIPLIASVSTVFYSEMVGIHDADSMKKHLRFSLLSVMLFIMPLIVGTWFTGEKILKLIFGAGFESQGHTLSILVLNSLAQAVILVIGFQTLGLRHRMRPVYSALFIGLLAGVIFGPTLVENFGYMGAAAASVGSRWVAAGIILLTARNVGLVGFREFSRPLLPWESF
ncbi:MAG: hypothetical protein EBU49_06865, partial [Proteobacteria bacterium]|nr:hypothetical protein [Pseudomonadota bacterium]